MQQWEYRFVSFEPRQPRPDQEPDWYLSYENLQSVTRATAPTIQAYTNQLGAEGWQLFHCHYVPRSAKSTRLALDIQAPGGGVASTP